jgi:hypothetical protein
MGHGWLGRGRGRGRDKFRVPSPPPRPPNLEASRAGAGGHALPTPRGPPLRGCQVGSPRGPLPHLPPSWGPLGGLGGLGGGAWGLVLGSWGGLGGARVGSSTTPSFGFPPPNSLGNSIILAYLLEILVFFCEFFLYLKLKWSSLDSQLGFSFYENLTTI